MLPKEMVCPNCKVELELDENERNSHEFSCPNCHQNIKIYEKYADFIDRFLAFIFDLIIIFFINLVILSINFIFNSILPQFTIINFILGILGMFVSFLYFPYLESSKKQATFGKLTKKIYITDNNLNRIGFGKASARFLLKILTFSIGITAIISFLMIFTDKRNQTLHDKGVGTLVLKI